MPLVLRRETAAARSRWIRDYVRLVIERDVSVIREIRHRAQLPAFLGRLAAQTAQVLNVRQASQAVGADHTTGGQYLALLESVFLVRRLPGWGRTLASRVAASPKVHVLDSGVAGHLLGLNADQLAQREPAMLTEFGHLLETFVVGELLKQVAWREQAVTASHFRTHDRVEVDIVLEHEDGRVAGIEVKASSTVRKEDLAGLRYLRNKLGERFVAGVVLSTGPHSYRAGERLLVAPVDRLWAPAG